MTEYTNSGSISPTSCNVDPLLSESTISGDSNNKSRSTQVKTYVVSIPLGKRTPMMKVGTIKQIEVDHQLKDIEDIIHEVEEQTIQMVTNNDIEVNCSKCCNGINFSFFKHFKGIKLSFLSKNKASVKTGDVKASVI